MTDSPSFAPSKLINIASGKGGVGKTWLAITLSHALSRAGQNVLLFDGDLGLANIDIQLGLLPETDLGSVIAGAGNLSDAVTTYQDDSNSTVTFDVIAGKSGSGALASLRRPHLQQLRSDLKTLSRSYDVTFLDLGAGIENHVTTLAGHDGLTVVVVTPDPTSLTDAYAFIKVHTTRNPDAKVAIAINMAEDRHEGKRTYETLRKVCENFLKLSPPLAGIIRRDRHVTAAIREQYPLLARYPQCQAAEDVLKLSHKLLS
ncbi:MAG: cobyrinic acid a,c-diamide synthase [Kordiimonas sp.]|nr:cobyrinic acid a,c-diamide synthase [Kordiimonas sp.]|tara:strand:+ start:35 stop:811 length:777 start_codon:yes stop_codon:yes gene_type:complete